MMKSKSQPTISRPIPGLHQANLRSIVPARVTCAGLIGILLMVNLGVAQEGKPIASAKDAAAESDTPRRSPEADAGPRRSPEAEQGRGRRDEARERASREGESTIVEREDSRRDFTPKTQREAELMRIINQLQREVAALRRQVQSRGNRDGLGDRQGRPDASPTRRDRGRYALQDGWRNSKDGRVFKAYDKNGDETVSLDEWLAMTNGNANPERRDLQTRRFQEAEPSGDGLFTPAEFIWWYSVGRHSDSGERRADSPSNGAAERDVPRDAGSRENGSRENGSRNNGPRETGLQVERNNARER